MSAVQRALLPVRRPEGPLQFPAQEAQSQTVPQDSPEGQGRVETGTRAAGQLGRPQDQLPSAAPRGKRTLSKPGPYASLARHRPVYSSPTDRRLRTVAVNIQPVGAERNHIQPIHRVQPPVVIAEEFRHKHAADLLEPGCAAEFQRTWSRLVESARATPEALVQADQERQEEDQEVRRGVRDEVRLQAVARGQVVRQEHQEAVRGLDEAEEGAEAAQRRQRFHFNSGFWESCGNAGGQACDHVARHFDGNRKGKVHSEVYRTPNKIKFHIDSHKS